MANDIPNKTPATLCEYVIIINDTSLTAASLGFPSVALFLQGVTGDNRNCLADEPLLKGKIAKLENRLASDYPKGDKCLSNVLLKLQENLALCIKNKSTDSILYRFSAELPDIGNYKTLEKTREKSIIMQEKQLIVGAEGDKNKGTYPVVAISHYHPSNYSYITRQTFIFVPQSAGELALPIIGNLDFSNPSTMPTSNEYFRHIPPASDFVTQACEITTRENDGSSENRLAFATSFFVNKNASRY